MKAYKGFNKDMTCTPAGGHPFQYEEGKTYHVDEAELCKSGFHACENPLDCFSYYSPADSVYHEVELEDVTDEKSDDSKRCGKTIKIGAKLSIAKLVELSIGFVKSKCDKANSATGYRSANSATGDWSVNSATGYRSANSATGDWSVNSATGDGSVNSATGYCSVNSATGYRSANSATGYGSANSATGDWSANSATGDGSVNSATGYWSVNSATGYRSANSATGDWSVNSATGDGSVNSATGDWSVNSATGDGSVNSATGYGSANISVGNHSCNEGAKGTISIGWGLDNRCRGKLGAYIVLVERGGWDGKKYPQIGEPKLGKIDGDKLKPDVWYKLENGEFVECEDGEEE